MNLAVYGGTFDPITNGHLDIIEGALKVFDKLVVAVATSAAKNPLFTVEERKELIEGATIHVKDRVIVDTFSGLLVDCVKKHGSKVIVRGLRAVSDYEYEAQMAMMNTQLCAEIQTVFLHTTQRSAFISSSLARQIAHFKGDIATLVPMNVELALREKVEGAFSHSERVKPAST